MSKKPRLGIFKAIATCPHCGHPVPFNGPKCKTACPSCQKAVAIDPQTWIGILNDFQNDYQNLEPGDGNNSTIMGEITLKCTGIRLPPPDPACPKCQTNWALAEIADGTDGVITCKHCGRTSPTYPPPKWLQNGVPAVRQIFFGEREAADAPADAAGPGGDSLKPIALACPQCNGGLLITAQTERTVKCKYCNVDVFLPDALWLKLHPVKEAKFWLVRFQ